MKSLILHIGANKTGSSAIQEFLRLNAEPLADLGVTVAPADLMPRSPVTGQHVWFVEQQLAEPAMGTKRIGNRIERLMNTMREGGRLLLSAENLANPTGAEQMFAEVTGKYDTKVILYVRRQDELLLSSWQQWESKITDDFWAWLMLGIGSRGDWRTILEAWERIVPREKITVRLYERAALSDGDIIADFAQTLGLSEHMAKFRRPEGAVNPSYAEAVVEFAKGNPLLFRDKHDNAFYNMVEQLTGSRYHRNPRESVISHEQRVAILQRYAGSNEWVRARYFPERSPTLFTEPKPDDYVMLTPEKLTAQKWELAASLIFSLARRALAQKPAA